MDQPPTAASVNPSAATAAVSAYNLSSAAAATALRTLPTPPTNVAAVQTKRTMRRSASVSSEGSRRALSPVPSIKRAMGFGGGKDTRDASVPSPAGSGAPALRRRGSSSSIVSMSSMTERTFRSPSPHNPRTAALAATTASPNGSVNSNRGLSTNAAGTAAAMAASRSTAGAGAPGGGIGNRSQSMPPPPVPSIPKHVIDSNADANQPNPKTKQQQQAQNRRATALGLVQQPLRLASQKQKGGRSSWFGSGAVGNLSDVRRSDAAMDINSYAQMPSSLTADGRPGSRNSLQNFSYPSRQRLGSPPPSPTLTRAGLAAPTVASTVPLPPATTLTRSASTERVPTQQLLSKQKPAASTARRSASTSRVTDRSTASQSDQTLIYDPNSRRMVPRAELLMLEQSILDAAERPQRQQRKKKQQQGTAASSLAGSHLSQGTLTHAHGTAAPLNRSELQRAQEPQPHPQTQASAAPRSPPPGRLPPKSATIEKPLVEAQSTAEKDFEDSAQPLPALSTSASTPSSSVSSLTALAASQVANSPVTIQSISSPEDNSFDGTLLTEDGRPVLVKRPSIVREEPDREEEEEQKHHQKKNQQKQPQPQLSSAAAVVAAAGSQTALNGLDGVPAKSPSSGRTDAGQGTLPAKQQQEQLPTVMAAEKERTRSNSPVRTAHFAPIPMVGHNLTVRRHSPPPRSISPRKSALKHTSSPRDASPSDSASEANPSSSQLSSDLAIQNRKKANRVSFDDKAVVVPQSPMPPSPPISPGLSSLPGASEASPSSHAAHQPPSRSRSWFSNIGRSKKKTGGDLAASGLDDDDMVMKPRPALPSFGSVRGKSYPVQQAQQEERALVRPLNDSQPPRQSTQSPPPSKSTAAPLETLSTSSDHAIGHIIGAEQQASLAASRNTANTSRFREPLPPIVTSIEGSGYVSDSGPSSDDDDVDVDDEDEAEEVEDHSPVLRFDEQQDTTVPAVLAVDSNDASDAVLEDTNEAASLPESSSPAANPPKKAVPAIAISHPSDDNATAVRGTEDDEDEHDRHEEQTGAPALPTSDAPLNPNKCSPIRTLFDVPGMFPTDSDSDGAAKGSPTKPEFAAGNMSNAPVPTRQNAFEPIIQDDDHASSPQMPGTVFATHMPTLHEEASLRNEKMEEDDSESEVFSDAYEDLSDIEGDGFLSLDAVVESPIMPDMVKSPFASSGLTGSPSRKSDAPVPGPSSPLAKEIAPTSPADNSSTAINAMTATIATPSGVGAVMPALVTTAVYKQLNGISARTEDEEDWEKIKAFWRGLTIEKRAQLEKEAIEDAADDADLDDASAAAKKPRRKKSVETRIAEKKAIQKESLPPQQEAESVPPVEQQSQKQAATRIRKSMRDNAGGGSTAAEKEHVKTPKQKPMAARERPVSSLPPKAAVGAVIGSQHMAHTRTFSSDSISSSIPPQSKSGVSSLLPSALRRRGSDSSESSFRRARPGSNGTGAGGSGSGFGAARAGSAAFRMSMRGDSNPVAAAGDNLNQRSSRFSLRSLSPTGSATLRGSTESSPQFRRTMRDGSGFTPVDMKRMSSPGPLSSSTLRKSGAVDSGGGGFFSSLGKKRGSKLLQRNKNDTGKSARTRFGDSSDEDDDIFGPTRTATGGGGASDRRSASAGAYTFRSRFVDSSDEDEIILDNRTVGPKNKDKGHVVPTTMRSGNSTMRSASARPASARPVSAPMAKSPPLPEELEEDDEDEALGHRASHLYPAAGAAGPSNGVGISNNNNNNIGTSTVRRSRSGRGQMGPMSPIYSPTTTGAVGLSNGSSASPTQNRRSSGIMSVLRRKKHDGPVSPISFASNANANKIQRAELMDSAARRDTQLERSTRELEAMRSNSSGSSRNRRAMNSSLRSPNGNDSGSTPRAGPGNGAGDSDDDEKESDESPTGSSGGPVLGGTGSWPLPGPSTNGVGNNNLQTFVSASGVGGHIRISELSQDKKKKKFTALRRMFRLDD